MQSIEEAVIEILMNLVDLRREQVKLSMSLAEDVGLDSIDTTEMVLMIEEEFNIEIPDEDVMGFVTIGDVVEYVELAKR